MVMYSLNKKNGHCDIEICHYYIMRHSHVTYVQPTRNNLELYKANCQ